MDSNLAVFTTKNVMSGLEPVVFVVHDSTGEWQFLGQSEVTMDDMLIVSLSQLLKVDPNIHRVLSMRPGYEATKLRGEWQYSQSDSES